MIFKNQPLVYELFEKQAKKTPGRIALSVNHSHISYEVLDRESHRIAGLLKQNNIETGDIAVVDCDSSFERIAAILGILKAGGAYLHVHPGYGQQYHRDVRHYIRAPYVVTATGVNKNAGETTLSKPGQGYGPQHPQAILFMEWTSPFTIPRGTVLSHRNINHWLSFNIETLRVDFTHTVFISTQAMEMAFPLWWANLITGGTVVFYQWEETRALSQLIRLMKSSGFKSMVCPLHFLHWLILENAHGQVLTANGIGIKNIITTGEDIFNAGELRGFIKSENIKWHNYYGFPGISMITNLMAETSSGENNNYRHVGKPAIDTEAFILNPSKQLVSPGIEGELYVSGKGVMDQYYRHRELNQQHFSQDTVMPEKKVYKTGYKAHWLRDWKIALKGRTDRLFHIKGCRFHAEEIEALLLQHPQVNDCAVVLRNPGGNTLEAKLTVYWVPEGEVIMESIEDFLRNEFPLHIIPIGFVRLFSIPGTPDGQPDRDYLEKDQRLDSLDIQTLEHEIKKQGAVEHVGILVEGKIAPPAPLHLKDLSLQSEGVPSQGGESTEELKKRFPHQDDHLPLAIVHGGELEQEDDDPRILPELLVRAARDHRHQGIAFIQPEGTEYFQSYSSLLQEAQRILAGLKKIGLEPQDKVIFQFRRNEDYVAALWGCILAGVVPVPLAVPRVIEPSQHETKALLNIWNLLANPVILTSENLHQPLKSLCQQFQLASIEELKANEPDLGWHEGNWEEPAIILFTSGSTGTPKGVVQCHRSILAREKAAIRFCHLTYQDISINWLPLEHVVGLFMYHIKQVYLGCQQVHAPREYILSNPLRWLDLISHHRVTFTFAPNFAYALLNRKFEESGRGAGGHWDLSCLRIANVGAEPINAHNMKKFLALFAPFGLAETAVYPSWGMSETSSGVVYSKVFSLHTDEGIHVLDKHSLGGVIRKRSNKKDTDTITLVEVGEPFAGVSLRIVDGNNRILKEGMMGRLQIKGTTVTCGYFKNPELNREVFTADGWFDTGDQAFIYNGRLTLTGRTRDVIIINGINYNNSEIEAAVESVEQVAISYTAACAVREASSITEKLAVFFSSLHSDFNRVLEQIKQIQKIVVQKIGIKADIIIPVNKAEIPKTAVGKIQRSKLAQLFESGYFDERVKQIDIGLENENTLPSWFFVRKWYERVLQRTALPTPLETKTICLIFMDESGLCETFMKTFARKNCIYIKVLIGRKFRELDEYCYEINYKEPGDYIHLFETLHQANLPFHDIFHCYGYGGREESGDDLNRENLKNAQYKGVYSLLNMIRGLDSYHSPLVRLLVVTSQARWVDKSGSIAYEKSGIPGFLRSISQELSWLKCCHVDFEPDSLRENAAWLFQEWHSVGKDFAVAYRNKRRFVPLLDHVDIKRETRGSLPIKKGGLYLVTGGLGGIGKYVCKWLMEKYQAKLIIVGRTPLPERNRWRNHLEEDSVLSKRLKVYLFLESAGKQFTYASGDICNEDFFQALIHQGESRWNQSLDGVFHLAGQGNWETQGGNMEGEMRLATSLTPQHFEAMFQSKVYATIVLQRLLRHKPDSLFVAFSSIISLMGAIGYSAYAAANSFLDNFCLYRRHMGFENTFCLNWSAWDNIGMNEGNPIHVIHAMRSKGYRLISPQQALHSMALALRCSRSQLLIGLEPTNHHTRKFLREFSSDKQVIKVFYSPKKGMDLSASAVYHHLSHHMPVTIKPKNVIPEIYPIDHMPFKDVEKGIVDYKQLKKIDDHSFRTAIEVALPETREEQVLVGIWKDILALNQVGVEDNFFELGGNSLKSFELVSEVHKAFQVRLPLEEIFKNPSIRKLSAYIKGSTGDKHVSLRMVEKQSWYELSSAQQRFYILQQMELQSTTYNVPLVIRLEGKLDKTKVENSFLQLIHRHESLRTSIRWNHGVVVQQVLDHMEFRMEYREETNDVEIQQLVKHFVRPFDLAAIPLLRVGLIRIHENSHIAMIDMHHIISDGVSLNILVKEFLLLYGEEKLRALKLQYKDFAHWQNSGKERKRRENQEKYWLREFAGEIPLMNLPMDFKRPKIQSFEGKTLRFVIDKKETRQLKTIGLQEEATLYMVLVSLLNILLAKLSGDEDIVIGTPIAGRRHADLQQIIGLFINTLLLRNFPRGEKPFGEFVKEVKQRTLKAFDHQDYPYEDLVERLCLQRDASRNPLFDVMFVLQDLESPELELYGLKAVPYDHERNTSKFDLTFQVLESGEQLVFWLEYCTALFKKETIERFANYLKKITSEVIKNPGIKISEIEIVTGEEKQELLYELNDTKAKYPTRVIHELFKEQVEKWPGKMAVKYGNRQLSYNELNKRSNGLARALRRKGVKEDRIVGVMVKPSIEMVIGILGILKAGGAYLPIDPDYPQDRIRTILKDCCLSILIAEAHVKGKPSFIALQDLRFIGHENESDVVDSGWVTANNVVSGQTIEVLPEEGDENLWHINQPPDLAYIIFTSGSTGKPKGVMIQHGNVVRLMFNNRFLFDFNNRDVWTLFHSCCFDFSVWEMYGALLYGGKLVVIPKMAAKDTGVFLEILKKEKVTVLNQVPSAFYNLSSEELKYLEKKLNLKYIIFGGEALKPVKLKELKRKYPETKFINMYGITETTVHVTYKEMTEKEIDFNLCNIGRPIPTLTTYVMDKNLKLQPLGVAGELVVGGDGVGRGYLNRQELTKEKFADNPYKPGEKLYKSGDLVKLLAQGEIEYLGRIDQQVKIRGFRIELGEIEKQLLDFAPVKEAVVLAGENITGDKQLVAYIVPDPTYAYPVLQLLKLENKGLLADRHIHELPNGMTLFYLNRNEADFMYREIFEEQSYMKHGIQLNDGACIFDIGANIGVFSLFVHQKCQDAKIYAFEPIPPVYQLLELNTLLYGLNIKLFAYGISAEEGETIFTYYPYNTVLSGRFADTTQEMKTVQAFIDNQPIMDGKNDRAIVSNAQVRELPEDRLHHRQFKCALKTLSQIIREHGVRRIDLLKIDVEKNELDVLAGINEEDWSKIKQLVIEVHDIDNRLNKIINLLEKHGYKVSLEQDNFLKNTDLHNIYAVHQEENEVPVQGNDRNRVDLGVGPTRYWHSAGSLKAEVRHFLKEKLPDYMIPSWFVLLEAIPLTANNKIDRKSLPTLEISGTGGQYLAPKNEVEKKMVEIWSEILGIEKEFISIDSNFFEIGGHSLKAAIMDARLHRAFNVKVPLAEIFITPTIKGLAEYINRASKDIFVSLEAAEKKEYYPLSSAQKRLYLLQQMDPQNVVYNIPYVVELDMVFDRDRTEDIFSQLIWRHDSFRTSFIMVEGEPVQRIDQDVRFEIESYCQEPYASIVKSLIRPFDLSGAPLLRVGMIHQHTPSLPGFPSQEVKSGGKFILMVDMHHIISDGISWEILIREFMTLYRGERLSPLRIQYKDYAQWQNSEEIAEQIKSQEGYWLEEFSGEIPLLNLPLDYSRPVIQSFLGSRVNFSIGEKETSALNKLAFERGATLYMVLLTTFIILLSKLSGQEDIVVGTAISNRFHADLEGIIGMFVNTLALRNRIDGESSLKELLKQVRAKTLKVFENQAYPFERLVEKVAVNRDASHNPLFDVMFSMHNNGKNTVLIKGERAPDLVSEYEFDSGITHFDLMLNVVERDAKLLCTIEYCIKLFKEETILRFSNFFKRILANVVELKDRKVLEIVILSEEEKLRILYDFNDTKTEYPENKSIQALFDEQVEKGADHTAVVFEEEYITYRELKRRSDSLTGFLYSKGGRKEDAVGIMMEHCLEMVIGVLAILKLGGYYLPINIKYPGKRKTYILNDSNARILLTDGALSNAGDRVEIIDVCGFEYESLPTGDRYSGVSIGSAKDHIAANLAYIIYTSGSTGNPKGVMVEHKNVIRLVKNTNYTDFPEEYSVLPTGALEFDASTFEIWGALLNGRRLYLVGEDKILTPGILKETLQQYGITTMWMTAPLFNRMVDADIEIFKTLRELLVGGDVLSPPHINQIRKRYPGLNVINGYGPTENTTFSTTYLIKEEFQEKIPIGEPIANSTVYILDRCGCLQPVHVAGELYVGGDGVARGYLNNPELTAEKFIEQLTIAGNRWINKKFLRGSRGRFLRKEPPGRRRHNIYKTGDLGWWLPDGNVEFLGRMDQQVKIRGYRIELEEIERQLLGSAKVKNAVVIAKKGEGGDKYLCGYIVVNTRWENGFKESELREYLSKELPDYMMPTYLVPVDRIPLTSNGKVDRKALPEPGFEREGVYTAPTTKTEKRLLEIWSEVLHIEPGKIAVNSSFFELGGHSLKATELISRIHKAFDVNIPLVEIFATPTIKGLAEYINRASTDIFVSIEAAEKKEYYQLSSAQKRLYFLQQVDIQSVVYNIPHVVQLEMELEENILEDIFCQLFQRHESFRTVFLTVKEVPVQQVLNKVDFEIEYYDMASSVKEQKQKEAFPFHSPFSTEDIIKNFIRPFDLSRAPLLRVGMIKLEEKKYLLTVDMHHIVGDGVSMEILVREFMSFYEGKKLQELQIQYKDYSEWQNKECEKRTETFQKREQYWLERFKGDVPDLNLPIDYPRQAFRSDEGNVIYSEIESQLTGKLKLLAKEEKVTLFILLFVVYIILLSKYSNHEDIVVGVPTAGREHVDLEHIIGMFVNMLAIRNFPEGNKIFREFLKNVKENVLDAYENQDYPFEELVTQLGLQRDTSRNPLFDTVFQLLNMNSPGDKVIGSEDHEILNVTSYDMEYKISHFDIYLAAFEGENSIKLRWEYSTALFREDTMEKMVKHFIELLEQVVENRDIKLREIKLTHALVAIKPDSLQKYQEDF